jgi:hypothetical protein
LDQRKTSALIVTLRDAGWPIAENPGVTAGGIMLDLDERRDLVALIFDKVSMPDAQVILGKLRALGIELEALASAPNISFLVLTRRTGSSKMLSRSTWFFGLRGRLRVRGQGRLPFLPDETTSIGPKWRRHPILIDPSLLTVVDEPTLVEFVDWLSIAFPKPLNRPGLVAGGGGGHSGDDLVPTSHLGGDWRVDAAGVVVAGQSDWLWSVIRYHIGRCRQSLFLNHGVAWVDHVEIAALDAAILGNAQRTIASGIWMPEDQWLERIAELRAKALDLELTKPRETRRPPVSFLDDALFVGDLAWIEEVAPLHTRQSVQMVDVEPKAAEPESTGGDQFDIRAAIDNIVDIPRQAAERFLTDIAQKFAQKRLVSVPPGTGKTSACLDEIIQGLARTQPGALGPIGFFSPTYANIIELEARSGLAGLDPEQTDDALLEHAGRSGIQMPDYSPGADPADELRDRAQQLGLARPLKIMTFPGRIKAGCRFPEKMAAAMKIGAGASLCHATDESDVDIYCPHFQTCPAIIQKRELPTADLVFMPHAFLALPASDEMQCLKGIVIDEAAQDLFLHVETETIGALSSPRRRPALTKSMKRRGPLPEEMLASRDQAWSILKGAISGNVDINEAFFRHPGGPEFAALAKAVCDSALTRNIRITPLTSQYDLDRYAAAPTAQGLRLEASMWSVILDILENRRTGDPRIKPTTKGGQPSLRIAWRSAPNWTDRPVLVLDASADPEIVGKIWAGDGSWVTDQVEAAGQLDLGGGVAGGNVAQVVLHGAGQFGAVAERSLTTIMIMGASGTSEAYAPRAPTDDLQEYEAALAIERARALITVLSGRNAQTRVLVGMSMAVRAAICTAWRPPANADFVHYGALRGLNSYERHGVALSIGRLELPPEILDGQEAALSFDSPGAAAEMAGGAAQIREERVVKLRGHRNIVVRVPTRVSRWGARLQRQAREEELRQFAGRLRAIPRAIAGLEPPLWMLCGGMLPDGMTPSAVLHVDDLVRDPLLGLWDIARRHGGVLHSARLGEVSPALAPGAHAYALLAAAGFDIDRGTGPEGWVWVDGHAGGGFVMTSIENPWLALRAAEELPDFEAIGREHWSLMRRLGNSEWTDCSKEPGHHALGQEAALFVDTGRRVDDWLRARALADLAVGGDTADSGFDSRTINNPEKQVWPAHPDLILSTEILSILGRRKVLLPR